MIWKHTLFIILYLCSGILHISLHLTSLLISRGSNEIEHALRRNRGHYTCEKAMACIFSGDKYNLGAASKSVFPYCAVVCCTVPKQYRQSCHYSIYVSFLKVNWEEQAIIMLFDCELPLRILSLGNMPQYSLQNLSGTSLGITSCIFTKHLDIFQAKARGMHCVIFKM